MRPHSAWHESTRRRVGFDLGAVAMPPADVTEYIRETPSRAPTVESDVVVTFGQAFISACAVLLFGSLVAYSAEWGKDAYTAVAAAAGAIFGVVWLHGLRDNRRLLRTVETVINEPEPAAAPTTPQEPRRTRVQVDIADAGKMKRSTFLDLSDGILDTLPEVARRVLIVGDAFSRRGLAGCLTEAQYNELRTAMLGAGLARTGSGKRTELTPAGLAMLRHVLRDGAPV